MHPFFADLSPLEVSLLLTTLTADGEAAAGLLALLDEPWRGRLSDKASKLMAFAPEVRTSLMAHELKERLHERPMGHLEAVDPTWVVQALRGESPRLVALLLLGLPAQAMRSVLRRLPAGVRRQLPPKDELARVAPELTAELRAVFGRRFAPMPRPLPGPRGVQSLLFLERAELYRLVRTLGFVELGQAFAAMEKMALVELCRRLGKEDARVLIAAVQTTAQVDTPALATAQYFLTQVVENFEDTEEFLQKSGLWRLARATLAEPKAWQRAMVQRLPRRVGELYAQLLRKATGPQSAAPAADGAEQQANAVPEQDTAAYGRLQDAVLVQVQRMAKEGRLAAEWGTAEMAYHDPDTCRAAVAAAEQGPAAANTPASSAGADDLADAATDEAAPRQGPTS